MAGWGLLKPENQMVLVSVVQKDYMCYQVLYTGCSYSPVWGLKMPGKMPGVGGYPAVNGDCGVVGV